MVTRDSGAKLRRVFMRYLVRHQPTGCSGLVAGDGSVQRRRITGAAGWEDRISAGVRAPGTFRDPRSNKRGFTAWQRHVALPEIPLKRFGCASFGITEPTAPCSLHDDSLVWTF